MNRFPSSSTRSSAGSSRGVGTRSYPSNRKAVPTRVAHRPPRPSLPPAGGSTQTASRPTDSGFKAALGGALFALPISLLVGVVFLLIAAGVAASMPDPDRLLTLLGIAVLELTALCGGLIAARRAEHAPLLCGLLFGGVAILALFIGSLCFGDETRQTVAWGLSAGARAGMYALTVAVSALGAVIGRKRTI